MRKRIVRRMRSKSKEDVNFNVTVKFVPHPNPQRAIDIMAMLVLKKILEKGEAERSSTA
ncbi:MAG: hypothetical protein PHV03_01845 [Desulfitobacteriaceae bacterium]|nr:hypothetical protein [Desulfitobacteriaceae bacterium]